MKAPDKIYIQPSTINELPRQNIIYTKQLSDTSINYIRKDALLEWVKLAYGKVSMNPFDCSEAFDELFYKIESL